VPNALTVTVLAPTAGPEGVSEQLACPVASVVPVQLARAKSVGVFKVNVTVVPAIGPVGADVRVKVVDRVTGTVVVAGEGDTDDDWSAV
jgi:hypothetical protein